MFKVKNIFSGRFAKDAILGKVFLFDEKKDAEAFAFSLNRCAVASEKRAKFVVVSA